MLFSLGIALDVPTNQGGALRAANYIDKSLAMSIPASGAGYASVANEVLRNFANYVQGAYAVGSEARYFQEVDETTVRIVLPKKGHALQAGNCDPSAFSVYGLSGNAGCLYEDPPTCTLNDLGADCSVSEGYGESGTLDKTGVFTGAFNDELESDGFTYRSVIPDSYKNWIGLYARFRPFQYLRALPRHTYTNRPIIEIASAIRRKNMLIYLLVDPSFSTDQTNLERIFSSEGIAGNLSGDTNKWPLANRLLNMGGTLDAASACADTTAFSWLGLDAVPSNYGLLERDPRNNVLIPTTSPLKDGVYFYSSLVDTLPFFYFKSAIVDTIDQLSNVSSYNSTTAVGVTGYSQSPALIPVFPIADTSLGYARHWVLETGTWSTFYASGLSTGQTDFWHGWVNTSNPSISSPAASGHNRWELCLGRGLYAKWESGGAIFAAPPQNGPTDIVDYTTDPLTRVRGLSTTTDTPAGSGVKTWCDDDDSVTTSISYSSAQNNPGGGGSEPVRNVIGTLAIRLQDNYLSNYAAGSPTTFGSKTAALYAAEDSSTGDPSSKTGYRYLPDAIESAVTHLLDMEQHYQLDPNYQKDPTGGKVLVVFSFGPWSKNGLTVRQGGTTNEDQNDARNHLRRALEYAVCHQVRVVLAYLPMSQFDLDQIALTLRDDGDAEDDDDIRSLLRDRAQLCAGSTTDVCSDSAAHQDPATYSLTGITWDASAAAEANRELADIHVIVFDWNDPRFQGAGIDQVWETRCRAAQLYWQEIPGLINKTVYEYEYNS